MKKTGIIAAFIILVVGINFPKGEASQSFGGITLLEITPRIITPNGDAMNDAAFFRFDSTLTGIPLDANIFDITGAKISGISLDSSETALRWDGKDDGGHAVPSGIYIYCITIGQKNATGTVVVAR